jgi:hypothetical protein
LPGVRGRPGKNVGRDQALADVSRPDDNLVDGERDRRVTDVRVA